MLTRLLLILFLLASRAHASTTERWFVLLLNNERAGYAHESESVAADGAITTVNELRINLSRLGQPVRLTVSSRFVESADNTPVLMESVQQLGVEPITERYEFTGGVVRHTTLTGERVTLTENLPLPDGDWLTPKQAERIVEQAIAAGDKTITIRTLDPSSGVNIVTQTSTIVGPATTEAYGKTVPAIEWVTEQSSLPGVTTREFVDHAGNPVRSEIDLGGIRLVLLASEKEVALSPASAPELMAQTLITPSRPIDNPRSTAFVGYVLTRKDGGQIPDLPDDIGGQQLVERCDDGCCARVLVGRVPHVFIDSDEENGPIERSAVADFLDPCIKELAERAVEGIDPDDTWKRAEAIRRAVHEHINEKSLGVGFATASETCATREGDCTEHAVLLAAALRAVGINSRAVSGLVYVPSPNDPKAEGVFGFHMWTQYQEAPYWYDLDATMGPERAFDATHIALSTSTLSPNEAVNTMAALVPLLGTLQIEVLRDIEWE